ncbi:MAG: hypothetical protein ABSD38_03720, partial [Syntrophorhabdales bacterium]
MAPRKEHRQRLHRTPAKRDTGRPGKGSGFQQVEPLQRFREMLFDLSAQLMSVEPSRIGEEIEISLRQAGEFWGLDAMALTEASDKGRMREVHTYHAPRAGPAPPLTIGPEVPYVAEMIGSGAAVLVSRLSDDLPPEASRDRRYFTKRGIKSALILPCGRDRPESVVLSALSIGRERSWPPELVKVFRHL